MTNICFSGLPAHLTPGMIEFAKEYGFELSTGGLHITLNSTQEERLTISRDGATVSISYHQPVQIFRAVGLVLEHLSDKRFETVEKCYFTMNGAMLDVSQGEALPTRETVFRLLRMMACMGLNCLMLYLEDTYEVEGEPYFGYMRPRYTQDELRAFDDYAYALGVEMIPCIQTLAHLTDLLRWETYADVREDESTLLVGEKRTYDLIEKMIRSSTAPFRSHRIHIGMDEAWRLGQGNYLLRHGLRDKLSIMSEHLSKVTAIVEKLGLRPMMWGDMFFRATLPDGEYYTQDDLEFPSEVLSALQPQLQIIYWDYYSNRETMECMTKLHQKLGRDVIFAGCVRNNRSFAYSHAKSTQNIRDGLSVAKEQGVRETFATVWGDNCPESSLWCILLGLQLYAEEGYAQTVLDEQWYQRFAFCTHGSAKAFEAIKLMDELPEVMGSSGNMKVINTSRFLLWQDPLLGLMDANLPVAFDFEAHYRKLSNSMTEAAERYPAHEQMFRFYASACDALALKADLGLRLTEAYHTKNRKKLAEIADDRIPRVLSAMERLCEVHRDLWMRTNQSIGWEVLDLRYGGAMQRLKTTRARVKGWLAGEIAEIEELKRERLPYNGHDGLTPAYLYRDIVSASRL
ncbi:MAG: beta-N-acetylhexosaminidase [Eubacteriales bacterium]|nr:beta-N-acetylhexosaminidase [Eubacteriales bacterium]